MGVVCLLFGPASPAKESKRQMTNRSSKKKRPDARLEKPQRKAEACKGAAIAGRPIKSNRRARSSEDVKAKYRAMLNKAPDLDAIRAELVDSYQRKPLRDMVQFDALIT